MFKTFNVFSVKDETGKKEMRTCLQNPGVVSLIYFFPYGVKRVKEIIFHEWTKILFKRNSSSNSSLSL